MTDVKQGSAMKRFLPGLLSLIMVYGCSSSTQNSNASNTGKSECPDSPQSSLESKNVKEITLGGTSLNETGQINTGKQKGFAFQAKKGQKFSYRTKDDVCVWVYAPNSALLKGDEIPVEGQYTVQVSAPRGSTSFAIDLELKDTNIAQTVTPATPNSSSSISSNQIDPEEFIRDHYANLNNRNYSETWKGLSSDFQGISGQFSAYTEWWNSVEKIRLSSTRLVRKDSNQAIVDAELQYVMKTGAIADDDRGRIYLSWSSAKNNWEIVKKTAP
jgi:hypothetical protein